MDQRKRNKSHPTPHLSQETKRKFKGPRKNRTTKKLIVFDEEKRKDYLTGFSKRKKERQRKAQEGLVDQWKEERKKAREELREQQRKRESKDASMLEDVLRVLPSSELHVSDHHRVTLTELDPVRLLEQRAGRLVQPQADEDTGSDAGAADIGDSASKIGELKKRLAKLSDVSSMQKSKSMRRTAAKITSEGSKKNKKMNKTRMPKGKKSKKKKKR